MRETKVYSPTLEYYRQSDMYYIINGLRRLGRCGINIADITGRYMGEGIAIRNWNVAAKYSLIRRMYGRAS